MTSGTRISADKNPQKPETHTEREVATGQWGGDGSVTLNLFWNSSASMRWGCEIACNLLDCIQLCWCSGCPSLKARPLPAHHNCCLPAHHNRCLPTYLNRRLPGHLSECPSAPYDHRLPINLSTPALSRIHFFKRQWQVLTLLLYIDVKKCPNPCHIVSCGKPREETRICSLNVSLHLYFLWDIIIDALGGQGFKIL